tara:strand:+ start:2252 stop:2545 length:294 start_codon:yes stop_codon:yes gene_type:complete
MQIEVATYFGEDNEVLILGNFNPGDPGRYGPSVRNEDAYPPSEPTFEITQCWIIDGDNKVEFDPTNIATWDKRMNMFHMLEKELEETAIQHIINNGD